MNYILLSAFCIVSIFSNASAMEKDEPINDLVPPIPPHTAQSLKVKIIKHIAGSLGIQ